MIQGATAPFFSQRFFNGKGQPLTGGRLEFYSAGSATPKSVYRDRALTITMGNNLPLDAGGSPEHYFMASGEYDIKIYDQFNQLIDNALRIDANSEGGSPYPDPTNPGFLRWDGSTYSWVEVPMYPTPGNSGYLFYNAETEEYSWVDITTTDKFVSVDNEDASAGYLADKLLEGHAISIETVNIGSGNKGLVVAVDESQLDKTPKGAAGGDLFGSYPDPRVKELTGTPAMLTSSIANFDWKQSGSWASGAGIGYGFGYKGGVSSTVWMAISQLGELQISYDEWKTTVYVDPSNAYYDDFMKPDLTLQPFNNLNAMQHYDVNGSYVTGGIRFASITYASLPGSTDKYWIISGEYQLFAIKDIPTNYNTNGSLKLENVFQLVITNGALDPNTVTSNSDIMIVTGNMSNIYYAEVTDFDLVSATKTVTFVQATITSTYGTGVFGSNAYNGSEYLTIGRDTGIILTSATGKTWTVKTATSFLFQDGTTMIPSSTGEYAGALPMYTTNPFNPSWARNGNGWGGLTYADGLWIVVNAKPAPSLISQYWSPFLFSEDGVKWSAYKPTQAELNVNYGYSMYKIAFGYGKFFATNSNPNQVNTTQPAIYRLLMNEIPAHRKLVAEKGIDVMGKIRLLDLPNASSLATDAEGNIIEGSGGGAGDGKVKVSIDDATPDYLGHKLIDSDSVSWEVVDDAGTKTLKANVLAFANGYFPTMDPASAVDVVMPSLTGTRSEIIVIANPRSSYKITQGITTKMGCAILQGATGEIVITIRDVNLNLIAYSYTRKNPTSDTLLELGCGVVFDPITHISQPDYTLECGIPYYLGINYSTNGCSFWGTIASCTTNILPAPSWKFNNLTTVPDTLTFGAGSEILLRPFIRVRG